MKRIVSTHLSVRRAMFPALLRLKSVTPVSSPMTTRPKGDFVRETYYIDPELNLFYDEIGDPDSALQLDELRKVGFLKTLLSKQSKASRSLQ